MDRTRYGDPSAVERKVARLIATAFDQLNAIPRDPDWPEYVQRSKLLRHPILLAAFDRVAAGAVQTPREGLKAPILAAGREINAEPLPPMVRDVASLFLATIRAED
jgi:hypothetical protein